MTLSKTSTKRALHSLYVVLMSTACAAGPISEAHAATACVTNDFSGSGIGSSSGPITHHAAAFQVVDPTAPGGVRNVRTADFAPTGGFNNGTVLVIREGGATFTNNIGTTTITVNGTTIQQANTLVLGDPVSVQGFQSNLAGRSYIAANIGRSCLNAQEGSLRNTCLGMTQGVVAGGANSPSPVSGTSTGGGVAGDSTSCASGPVVLASVDISSSQAEDLIRQRRELAQQETAADQASAAEAAAAPAEDTGTAKLKKAKKKASKSVPKPVAPAASDSAAADPGTEATLSPQKTRAGWAQIYGDYEVHKNMAPGKADNPTRRQRTFGQVGGADTTYHRYSSLGDEQFQFGFLGGHNETKSKFSDTPNSQNASIREEGGFAGAYASYRVGRFAADALFKADFYQLDKRAILLRTRTTTFAEVRTPQTLAACPTGQIRIADSLSDLTLPDLVTTPDPRVERIREEQRGSVSETNYSIGGNLYYRFDVTDKVWFEPMVGSRFTYTDFGSGAADIDLTNGQSLRVQGGARIGTGWVDVHSHLWTVSLLGMLYSDVYVDGYSLDENGFVSTAAEVDEGKLRALAQLSAQVEVREGLSFLGQADVRGGEDVRGFGGRLGVRYEW